MIVRRRRSTSSLFYYPRKDPPASKQVSCPSLSLDCSQKYLQFVVSVNRLAPIAMLIAISPSSVQKNLDCAQHFLPNTSIKEWILFPEIENVNCSKIMTYVRVGSRHISWTAPNTKETMKLDCKRRRLKCFSFNQLSCRNDEIFYNGPLQLIHKF